MPICRYSIGSTACQCPHQLPCSVNLSVHPELSIHLQNNADSTPLLDSVTSGIFGVNHGRFLINATRRSTENRLDKVTCKKFLIGIWPEYPYFRLPLQTARNGAGRLP